MTQGPFPPNVYIITHRETQKRHVIAANSADEACRHFGYLISGCCVQGTKTNTKHIKGKGYIHVVRVPIEVCPYQFAECTRPPLTECTSRPAAPDLKEWIRQTAASHLCRHVGAEITRKQWQRRYKWLEIHKIPTAINRH